MNISLVVRFQIIGFHYWPDAPEAYTYLSKDHRHTFQYIVEIPGMTDPNRQMEFIDLKHQLQHWVGYNYGAYENLLDAVDFGPRSCEMLAIDMVNHLAESYGLDGTIVEVNEDGENGAIVRC